MSLSLGEQMCILRMSTILISGMGGLMHELLLGEASPKHWNLLLGNENAPTSFTWQCSYRPCCKSILLCRAPSSFPLRRCFGNSYMRGARERKSSEAFSAVMWKRRRKPRTRQRKKQRASDAIWVFVTEQRQITSWRLAFHFPFICLRRSVFISPSIANTLQETTNIYL